MEGGGHESWKGIVGFVFSLLCINNSMYRTMSNGRMDISGELGRGWDEVVVIRFVVIY
jgi:hypothetical protein